MYLNDFRKEIVLEVFEEIKNKNIPGLLCRGFPESLKDNGLAQLAYHSEIHRLDIGDFNLKSPLYPNPDMVCELAPRNVFINSLSPSSDYHRMMSS